MKNLNIKQAMISSLVVYLIGITSFILSYFIPLLDDKDLQANLVLMITIIPAVLIGANLYYRKGYHTKGLQLGIMMFLGAMTLDALITVPFFIIPYGGSYLSFFGDPGFWLIAIEYVAVVTLVSKLKYRLASLW